MITISLFFSNKLVLNCLVHHHVRNCIISIGEINLKLCKGVYINITEKKFLRYITFVISKYQISNTVNNIIYLTFCQLITFSISNSQAWLSYIAN